MSDETLNSMNSNGETLNDRLRRAAAMAQQQKQEHPEPVSPYRAPEPEAKPAAAPATEPKPEPTIAPEPVHKPTQTSESRPQQSQGWSQPRQTAYDNVPEYEEAPTKPNKKGNGGNGGNTKIIIIVLAVLLILLVIGAIALFTYTKSESNKQQEMIEQLQLQNEQIQLANEYDALNQEFAQYENQTAMLANDSIVQKYAAAKAQVEKLLQELKNEKNKSAAQISKLKSEIETLKAILRNYVEQIDALNKENRELRTENEEVKAKNEKLSKNIQSVQEDNKVLNEQMTLARKLNVTGVNLVALNKKGKSEKNVTKAKQLMVTFTIPQNNSTPVGEKVIYLRLTNPEGDLLTGGGSFQFEGTTLQASARKSIEYAGEEIGGITMYWDVNATLTPGDYTVELFCDNYRLVSKRFSLTK